MVSIGHALLLHDLDYLSTFILPAMGANAVGEFRLVAIGAFRDPLRFQGVVSATILCAPVRVASFRIRHMSTSKILSGFTSMASRAQPAHVQMSRRAF